MKGAKGNHFWRPSPVVGGVVIAVVVIATLYVRLHLYRDFFLGSSFGFPLLIFLWHRRQRELWLVAWTLVFLALAKAVLFAPTVSTMVYWGMFQVFSTLLIAVIIHLVINITKRLDEQNAQLKSQKEAALRSEEQLRLVLEGGGLGAWDWDLRTNKVMWDARARQLFGLPHDFEVTYAWHIEHIHPDDRQKVLETVAAAGVDRKPFATEYRNLCADGTQRWIASRGRVYYDEAGIPCRMSGTVQDISEHKRAQEALLQEKAFSDAVIDNMPGMFYVIGENGRFVRWNRNVEPVTGYSASELASMNPLELFSEEDRPAIAEGIAKVFATGAATMEARGRTKQGTFVPLLLTGFRTLIYGQSLLVGMGMDLTERKRAEEALRQEKAFSDAVIDSMPGVFYVLLENGQLVRWNRNVELVTGYSGEELKAMDLLELFAEESRSTIASSIAEVFTSGESSVEANGQTKDGRHIPYFFTGLRTVIYGQTLLVGMGIDITERKRAEEAFHASEARFRAIFAATQDAMLLVDDNGRCVEVNPAAQTLLEGTAKELIDASIGDFLQTEVEFDQLWGKFRAEGCFEKSQVIKQDAKLIYAEVYGVSGVVPNRHLFVFHDITEREKLLRDHQAQRTFLDQLIRAATTGIMVVSAEQLRVTLVNPWFVSLAGFNDAGEMLGKTLWEIAPAQLTQTGFPNLRRASETMEPISLVEVEADLGPGREQTWWNVRIVPFYGMAGEGKQILLLMDDVTAQVRARKALAENEERLSIATEAGDIGAWDYRPRTQQLIWSDRCKKLFGVPPDTVVTYGLYLELVHPEDRAAAMEDIRRALDPDSDGKYRSEYRIQRPDRTVRWISALGQAFFEEIRGKREPVRFVGTVIDVTDRKLYEQQLRALADELARSNRDLEQFAYVASHDLQEPLRQISGFADILNRRYHDQFDESARELFSYIVQGTNRMQSLIRDLLVYSRVGRGGREKELTSLQALLDTALLNLKTSIEDSAAVITHDHLPTLRVDGPQIIQVFQNLVANAIKFRADTTPRIHVGAQRNADYWLLSVRDNGIGFPQEQADRVFDLFQRLGTRRDYPGTGIGLSICRRVIETHGGKIWAEAEPGKGATFYFTLPA